jgi:hypothetical protein
MSNKHVTPQSFQTPAELYAEGVPLPYGDGRCMFRFPSGPRCRQSASQIHPYLCDSHLHQAASPEFQKPPHSAKPGSAATNATADDPALVSDLLDAAGELTSAGDVTRVLRTVFRAMVERRLSPKEAGTLCYLAQTILHSQRATALQQKLEAEAAAADEEPEKLTWNLPR